MHGLLVGLLFFFHAIALSAEPPEQTFDDIDQMLDRQFQQKSAQIDELYDAYSKAIDDAFKGITKKIKVEWPDDIKLPEKSIWVGYSKNLKTRSIVDYQQGEVVIETKVNNKNINQAKHEIEKMAKQLSANNNEQIEQLDLFSAELKNNLISQGVLSSQNSSQKIKRKRIEQPNLLKQLLPKPQGIVQLPVVVVKKVNLHKHLVKTTKAKHSANKQIKNPPILADGTKIAAAIQNKATVAADIEQKSASVTADPNFTAKTTTAPATTEQKTASVTADPNFTTKTTTAKTTTVAKLSTTMTAAQSFNAATESIQSREAIKSSTTEPKIKLELIAQGDQSILKMSIKFVNNYQKVLMAHNFNDVKAFSAKYKVPISVILAIIETESSYNPRAISKVPAFGLMQLVPKTAGIDAHNYIYGQKKLVSPDYLFDETNNLQLGTAYFKLLKSRYLRKIKNARSRFYCAVASYNTGVGNLARTFVGSKSLSKAAVKINQMTPAQVYAYLLEHLPAEETKNYLKKIVARAAKYEHFDQHKKES